MSPQDWPATATPPTDTGGFPVIDAGDGNTLAAGLVTG